MQTAQPLQPLDDTEEVGYRGQMLIADGASVALMFSGTRQGLGIGALGYLILGPVIHGSHDQGGRTAVSLGLRIGLPLLGALAFAKQSESSTNCGSHEDLCDDDDDEAVSALVGFGVGMLAAMVVDDLIVARPVTVHKESQRAWAPVVKATSQKVSVGVLGRF